MGLTRQEQYERIAELVVERSLGVKKGETVGITTWEHTLDAAGAFYYAVKKRGAGATIDLSIQDAYIRAMKELDVKSLKAKDKWARAWTGTANANIWLSGPRDPTAWQSIPVDKMRALHDPKEQRELEAIGKRRKVRSAYVAIGQPTPERAKAYGLDIHEWEESVLSALTVDPADFARAAEALKSALKKGKEATITSADGSSLSFKLAGRDAVLDDGVIKRDDLKRGDAFVHLPAGTLFLAPHEGTAEGKVSFDLPSASRGRWIKGLWAETKKGSVTATGAAEGKDELDGYTMAWAKGKKLRIGYLTIGVNPEARPGFVDNQMASGVLGVHCGDNDTFGGKLKNTEVQFGGFSGKASLEVDGGTLVERGRIVA